MPIHYATCPLCEATCGLTVDVRDGEIRRIAGDDHDPLSRGFICPKGATLGELHKDPDRLRAPLVRGADGSFENTSWEEAFALIAERLRPAIGADPRGAAVYLGNPNVHSPAGVLLTRRLARALNTPNVFSASTVDQMPKHVACGLMYGDPEAIPVPDLDRTDFLLMLGANPWESNGSLCTAPDFPARIKALKQRGGRFVVVDPRRTRTAEHATEHLRIRPGSDVFFLLALAHVQHAEGLVHLDHLAPHVRGLDAVGPALAPFSPERVALRTGISAERITELARELARAERAAVYGRMGTHTVGFGTLGAWAVDLLNVLSGRLDAEGGAMWAQAAHMPTPRLDGPRKEFRLGRWKSRVHGYPEAHGELPSATLADEILTPGEGQVRVLVTVAGNPVLSCPDSQSLDRALAGLEFMVSVDPYLNETTRHAHVILPPPSPLTRSHYDIALSRLSIRNRARWSLPVLHADGPSEAEILARLTLIAGGRGAGAAPGELFSALERQLLGAARHLVPGLAARSEAELAALLEADEPVDRIVEVMIRSGAYGDGFGTTPGGLGFASLRDQPHGVDLGPLRPQLPALLRTPSGKVELLPEALLPELVRAAAELAASAAPNGLTLVGRRDLRSNNSWLHNLPTLVKGKERCTLHIHPRDAAARGIEQGARVRVSSARGAVVVGAELTDDVLEGVVSLPHGYGHGAPGSRMRVAAEHAGVNVNVLTDTHALDPLSGNAVLNGYAVRVEPWSEERAI
jgi:anaerobic selenocysteine-containing dehydrogenase